MVDVAGDAARIFADLRGIAETGTYTPEGGSGAAVRAVRVPAEPGGEVVDPVLGHEFETFLIQAADVAAPAAGDTLEIGGLTYRLQGVPTREAVGAFWRCDVWRDEARALGDPVTFERATYMRNDLGEDVPAWSALLATVGSVQRIASEEIPRAGVISARTRIQVTVRQAPEIADLSAEDRLIWGGEVWSIESAPLPAARGQWVVVEAAR